MNFTLLITVVLTALTLVAGAFVVAKLIGPRSYNPVKGEPFECGIPTRGSSWMPMNVGYYLFAILFLMFDIETVLLGAVALLLVSALLAVSMGTAFMPEMDSPQVSVSIEMPQEATTEESRAMCDTVLERILSVEGVSTVGAMESQSLMGGGSSLSIYVLLGEERSESSQQIARRIEEATADLDCTVTANGSTMDMSMMTGGSGIRLAVTGDDMDILRQTAAGLAGKDRGL